MSGILKIVVLLCLPAVIKGFCQIADSTHTRDDGTTYCKRYNSETEMDIGEFHLVEEQCFNCSCSDWGLSCCVYGTGAYVQPVDEACVRVPVDACNWSYECP